MLPIPVEKRESRLLAYPAFPKNRMPGCGKFQFHVFSALAEFERDLIRERTMAGLRAARARGKVGGRPKKMTEEKIQIAARLMKDGQTPVQS